MKRLILSVLTIGLVSVTALAATRAYFTDQAEILGNSISTGTVKLLTRPTSEAIVFENLKPGWNVGSFNQTGIVVQNDGTLPVKYRMRAVVTEGENYDALLDAMKTNVYVERGTGGSLSTIFKGTLRDLFEWNTIETNFEPTGHSGWFGIGQRIRIYNSLPYEVGNEVQGQSLEFVLEFEATQVDNPSWEE